jgi:hypothetical protein
MGCFGVFRGVTLSVDIPRPVGAINIFQRTPIRRESVGLANENVGGKCVFCYRASIGFFSSHRFACQGMYHISGSRGPSMRRVSVMCSPGLGFDPPSTSAAWQKT